MRTILALALISLLTASAWADQGDDTLRRWLAKADVVLVGKIRTPPLATTMELGVINYHVDLDVTGWLKGKGPKDANRMRATVVRFELDEDDRVSWLVKDSEVILFLNRTKGSGALRTTDNWFGAQKKRTWLLRSLKRLAKESSPGTKTVARAKLRPHAAALTLLLERCARDIEELESPNNDWHDVTPRRFVIRRPFWPGTIDSTHTFDAEYYLGDTLLRRWSIDLRERAVLPKPEDKGK